MDQENFNYKHQAENQKINTNLFSSPGNKLDFDENISPTTDDHFETRCGVVIAIFAALMSVGDLFAGKYGADEIMGTNEKSQAYMWYQAKSIKENLLESELAQLQNLLKAGVIKSEAVSELNNRARQITGQITQYSKEKKEILLGSKAVGKENWVQDKDGKLGQIKGAVEYELELQRLAHAGDRFDFGSLLFQMCLVLGALALVLKKKSTQQIFFQTMLGFGSLATAFTIWGLISAL